MCGLKALRLALDLWHMPSRIHYMRTAPLPEGIPLLLRIAAGEAAAEREAIQLIDRPLTEIQEAAGFFIEQILFAPESSSYRVLGASPEASNAELRRNMALLVRWLHPDGDCQADRRVFIKRVTSAWDDVKTAERRAGYDRRIALDAPPSYRPSYTRPHLGPTAIRRRNRFLNAAPVFAGDSTSASYRRETTGTIGYFLSFLSRKRWD